MHFHLVVTRQHPCPELQALYYSAIAVTIEGKCKVWLAAQVGDRSQCLLCPAGKLESCLYR